MSSKMGSFMDMGVKGGMSLSPILSSRYFSVTSDILEDEGPGDEETLGPGDIETPGEWDETPGEWDKTLGEWDTDKLKLLAGLSWILLVLHSPVTELPDKFGLRFLANRDWIRCSRILSSY